MKNKMKLEKINLFGKEVFPIGIPSGTVATDPRCAARLFGLIEEIGMWTTKSYTRNPRNVPEREEVDKLTEGKGYGFREPILEAIGFGSFVNAVGLTNPGCEKGRQEIIDADIPKDRIILGSSAGNSPEDFAYIMRTLDDVVDAHEMNVSCPHAEGMGIVIGSKPELVYEYVSRVVNDKKITKPIIVKLPPVNNISEVSKAAVNAGAFGLSGINTVPGYSEILTNKNCGISGRNIFRRALRCVRDIRIAVGENVFIQGMGGIATAKDAEMMLKYSNAIAIGSAFAGMTEKDMKRYLDEFEVNRLEDIDTFYESARVDEVLNSHCDFKIFQTDISIDADAGQFVFAYIPGVGEKPFSVMDDDPLTLGVLEKGYFTKHFNQLKKGDEFYFRGPYGNGINVNSFPFGRSIVLVGGGCGIAGLYLLAKQFSKKGPVVSLLGAKDRHHLPYLKEFKRAGEVLFATENGSAGKKGLVKDLFDDAEFFGKDYFFNCGPRAMIESILPLELEVSKPNRIYTSIDYITRCGIGLCGSCSDEKGRRTCVEGPFMNLD